MDKLKGTGVALVTPFTQDLEVDYEGLKKLLDFNINGGVNYLVINGTTAESVTTTKEEKQEILTTIRKHVAGRVPLVYGIGGNNTQLVLQTIRETDFQGIDAILSVSPYYNKPSQQGIYQHYLAIAEACPVPVILYNVPGRTGSNVTAETTLKLSRHDNIIGIKEASGNLEQCMNIVKGKPDGFLVNKRNIYFFRIIGCEVLKMSREFFAQIGESDFRKRFQQFLVPGIILNNKGAELRL